MCAAWLAPGEKRVHPSYRALVVVSAVDGEAVLFRIGQIRMRPLSRAPPLAELGRVARQAKSVLEEDGAGLRMTVVDLNVLVILWAKRVMNPTNLARERAGCSSHRRVGQGRRLPHGVTSAAK